MSSDTTSTCCLIRIDTIDNTGGDIPEASEEPVPLLSLISKFGIVMNLMIVVLAFINVGYTDATLAHHLGQV